MRDYLICFQCGRMYVYDGATGKNLKSISLNIGYNAKDINALLDANKIKREKR